MTNSTFHRLPRAAALLVVGMVTLTACAGTTPAAPLDPPTTDGVVIVTNARANVPMPTLSPANAELINQVLRHGLPVTVVSADGTPELVPIPIPEVKGNNEHAYEKSLGHALRTVQQAITPFPNSDGADAYGAMAVARDAAQARGHKRPTIICLQCGLDTSGALAMTADNAVRAEPQDFVDHLTATKQLVRFDAFEEATVVLTSLGQTASPQQPLIASDRENLLAIWETALTAGGATVVVDPQPASGDAIATDFTVPVIELTPPVTPTLKVCEPQSVHFDGASSARFVGDSDQWLDPAAAREALRPLAVWLRESGRRTAAIQGTTVDIRSGRPDEGMGLSFRRATAARNLMVDLGVAPEQIVKVEGLGPHYPGRIEDRDAQGTPIPSLRVKNRKVIVTLHDAC